MEKWEQNRTSRGMYQRRSARKTEQEISIKKIHRYWTA
jgi:hypothetical protein